MCPRVALCLGSKQQLRLYSAAFGTKTIIQIVFAFYKVKHICMQIYVFACKYTYIKNKYTHLHAKYMYIWNKLGTKTTFQIVFVLAFETNFWAARKVSFCSTKLVEWLCEKKFKKICFWSRPGHFKVHLFELLGGLK